MHAISGEPGAKLDLYADGAFVDSMTYKSRRDRWESSDRISLPAEIEVVSDCGGSDSYVF